jgi:quercetin dioxygenase-like cupin family protein
VEIPVGQATGWHLHPTPCTAYVLQGEVTVETGDGPPRTFKAGNCFAEMVNRRHCGRNTGTLPVKILMFVIGTEGTPASKAIP